MELYPKSVTKQCHQMILEQMNRMNNSMCKIKNKKEIGFFCHIKYNYNKIPVIIINNYINNNDYFNQINIILNNKEMILEIEEIIYKIK